MKCQKKNKQEYIFEKKKIITENIQGTLELMNVLC